MQKKVLQMNLKNLFKDDFLDPDWVYRKMKNQHQRKAERTIHLTSPINRVTVQNITQKINNSIIVRTEETFDTAILTQSAKVAALVLAMLEPLCLSVY